MLNSPQLTFFCELAQGELQTLFTGSALIEQLRRLKSAVSLGLLDLSPERAQVVRGLNAAGIEVIAWLLLPAEQGYWLNLDNCAAALDRYQAFRQWTEAEGLRFSRIGLDIEPDIRLFAQWRASPWQAIVAASKKVRDRGRLQRAQDSYRCLIAAAQQDGYKVDAYVFPLIADERRAGTTLLQRLSGLVDLKVDREVWMIYSSQFRPYGSGLLGSYAPEARAVAVGVTGGGVDTGVVDSRPLTWEEFARDLRLVWRCTPDIHIFSLEGCLRQGFLPRLAGFEWEQQGPHPALETAAQLQAVRQVGRLRAALRGGLRASRYTWILPAGAAGALVWSRLRANTRSGRKFA